MLNKKICSCGRFQYCNAANCQYGYAIKKRGSTGRPVGRFGKLILENEPEESSSEHRILQTRVQTTPAKSIISTNNSPDIPWSKTVNPYIGCEHGCIYCYARPTHAYYDLSPGLDFESRLFAKTNAAELLRYELSKPHYRPTTIGLGTNTDAYQPIERKYRITHDILKTLQEFQHPVSVLTKNSLILRDIDILTALAEEQLVEVHITLTSLNHQLSRILEPRASLPDARLETIRQLSAAGIPVKAMFSPVIPGINDQEMLSVMTAARQAGATCMGYILIRLPYEVRGLFADWLAEYFPKNQSEIMTRIDDYRDEGYRSFSFAARMIGEGKIAQEMHAQFQLFFQTLGFREITPAELNHTKFTRRYGSSQMELF